MRMKKTCPFDFSVRAGKHWNSQRISENLNQLFLPYFRWNRSTRPAVSINFCFPVKKGWHLEQISRWISPFVDRVLKASPHAQETVDSTYFGWMFGRMYFPYLNFEFNYKRGSIMASPLVRQVFIIGQNPVDSNFCVPV
jgi:hypothetical protein